MKISTKDFCVLHSACSDGRKWALGISDDLAVVWDAMISGHRLDWLLWTATRPGVFSDRTLRLLACRFVRETPLADGRKVWDLLTDQRSLAAVEAAERHARGEATDAELAAAWAAARDAARDAAWPADAAWAAAWGADAARDAAWAAAAAAAWSAARDADADAAADWAEALDAQLSMVADLRNPF